jgi:hypothetical protein
MKNFYSAIILDLDGVVLDFSTTFINNAVQFAIANKIEIFTKSLSPSNIDSWDFSGVGIFPDEEKKKEHFKLYWDSFCEKNCWKNIEVYGGAAQVIQNWQQLGIPLYFLTQRPQPYEDVRSYLFSKELLGNRQDMPSARYEQLIVVQDKMDKIQHIKDITKRHEHSVFFDDNWETIEAVLKNENERCSVNYVVHTYAVTEHKYYPNLKKALPVWDGSPRSIPYNVSQQIF